LIRSRRRAARALVLGLLLSISMGASVQADSLGRAFQEWAGPGEPLPLPEDARKLSLQFMEWEFLADWVRATASGEDPGELPKLWARLHGIRVDDVPESEGALQRIRRGICLHEDLKLTGPALLVYCDSLLVPRPDKVRHVYAGLLQGHLLDLFGLPGCGDEGDPSQLLIDNLGRVPRRSLEEIKEGRDYADHFFAAERIIEELRVARLGRVREFLARPGQLISLKYSFHKPSLVEPVDQVEQLDDDHWLYRSGLRVEWGEGHHLDVEGLDVLHTASQHLYQLVDPTGGWSLEQDGEALETPTGRFELDGEVFIRSENLELRLRGGRYRLDESELRLWLPGGFLETNRRELLFSFFLLIVIVYLLGNVRRQRRKLEEPMTVRRPDRARRSD